MTEPRDRIRRQAAETDIMQDRFDEALRQAVEPGLDDDASSEDADASAFLERFPAAARHGGGPEGR